MAAWPVHRENQLTLRKERHMMKSALALSAFLLASALLRASAQTVAQPVNPPTPNYPDEAGRGGIVGKCILTFDVSSEGKAERIRADCTKQIFCETSIKAIKRVEFAIKIVDGQRMRRKDTQYPLEFALAGRNGKPIREAPDAPLKTCHPGSDIS